MAMYENLLIICGDYHIFFFSINNNSNSSSEEELWELVLTFRMPHVEWGFAFSDWQLVYGGPDNIYSMNLKVQLQSILTEKVMQQPSDGGMDDDVVEVEISPG
mmetsp:Transcript_35627/g.65316  ORF Transcript_35627/g.65316 Transcript_35627/m.65316 type:complete len:103 (-) Transcript_35627:98-406(-)